MSTFINNFLSVFTSGLFFEELIKLIPLIVFISTIVIPLIFLIFVIQMCLPGRK